MSIKNILSKLLGIEAKERRLRLLGIIAKSGENFVSHGDIVDRVKIEMPGEYKFGERSMRYISHGLARDLETLLRNGDIEKTLRGEYRASLWGRGKLAYERNKLTA